MEKENLTEKVLEQIKSEKLEPKSKWSFLLKEYVLWLVFGLVTLIGGVAVSVIIFLMKNEVLPNLKPAKGLVFIFPYFWILLLVVFLFLAYLNVKFTRKGYKYNPYLIIVVSILVSIVLGLGLFLVKGAEKVERGFYQHVPVYQKMMKMRGKQWLENQDGRLAGEVVSELKNDLFILKSFHDGEWQVETKKLSPKELQQVKLQKRLKVLGQRLEGKRFLADKIQPWFWSAIKK